MLLVWLANSGIMCTFLSTAMCDPACLAGFECGAGDMCAGNKHTEDKQSDNTIPIQKNVKKKTLCGN